MNSITLSTVIDKIRTTDQTVRAAFHAEDGLSGVLVAFKNKQGESQLDGYDQDDSLIVTGRVEPKRTEDKARETPEIIVSKVHKSESTLNLVNLVGRLGRDPETKYFESGKIVSEFSIAINSTKKDDPPHWFNIQLWDKAAEIAGNYCRKGNLVGITGSLTLQHWQDKQTGSGRCKTLVKGQQLYLLGSKQDSQHSDSNSEDESRADGGVSSDDDYF